MFKKRRAINILLDLTPMVDVVFLLVIFLMTSATFVKRGEVDIQLPKSDAVPSYESREDTIWLTKENQIYLNQEPIEWNELDEALEAQVASGSEAQPPKGITIKADREVLYEEIIRLMGILKRVGVGQIHLSTEVHSP